MNTPDLFDLPPDLLYALIPAALLAKATGRSMEEILTTPIPERIKSRIREVETDYGTFRYLEPVALPPVP